MKKLNIYVKNNQGKTVIDMVQLRERETFLNMLTKSYYNYLKKYENSWMLEWQNKCSKEKLEQLDEDKCFKLIRNTLTKDRISVPEKKNKINIVIEYDEIIQFTTFTGSPLDMICGFKYLTKKYPTAVTMLHSYQGLDEELDIYNRSLGIQENTHQHILHFEIRWIYQRIFLPPEFETILTNIIKQNKYRYLIMPIGIILSNGNHSNTLLYDIQEKILERFEPHGSGYPNQFNYNPDLLDETLYKKIGNILSTIYHQPTKIKYYQPKNYLPKIGFQTFENSEMSINKNIGDPNGFCTLWCIWYLDYRLKYFNEKPQNIVRKLIIEIKRQHYSFRTVIRNYSKKITDLRDHYLSSVGHNINDYLNNKFTITELKNILIAILTDV